MKKSFLSAEGRLLRVPLLYLLLFFILTATIASAAQKKPLDVPFVPTKHPIVDEMLRLANVGKNDIVYDLGCGDGRIVIAAAVQYGAHAVGVDIDPERIQESKANAAKAQVTNLVRFIEQDLFQADLKEATVVTLYLLSSVNLKLRPKLLRELSPGTRIVSHNFSMSTWKSDKTSTVTVDEDDHTVYFWVVPANITGTWEITLPAEKTNPKPLLEFDQQFQFINGTLTLGDKKIYLKDAMLSGGEIQFTVERDIKGKAVTQVFEGHVRGNTMEGSLETRTGTNSQKGVWKAARNPATFRPLDTPGSPLYYPKLPIENKDGDRTVSVCLKT